MKKSEQLTNFFSSLDRRILFGFVAFLSVLIILSLLVLLTVEDEDLTTASTVDRVENQETLTKPTLLEPERIGTATTLESSTPSVPGDLISEIGQFGLGNVPGSVTHSGTEKFTVSAPGANLPALVKAAPEGASFYFPAGTYRFDGVVPKDGMTFIGSDAAEVIVNGQGKSSAFHGTADRVSIANMTLRNFNGTGGVNPDTGADYVRQEQAPIRGTKDIWFSERGKMATNWVIENIVSEGGYASGLFLGENFVVRSSVFRNNGTTGIAGDHIVGGLIEGNSIYGNGAFQAIDEYGNGAGIKLTQAGTPESPVVIQDNEVYDNGKHGIWCDLGCEGFYVYNNLVRGHSKNGIMLELSRNGRFIGNTLRDTNDYSDFNHNFNGAAINISEASDVVIEDNKVINAKSALIVHHAIRPNGEGEKQFITTKRYPTIVFDTDNVVVKNNVFTNVKALGISTGANGTIANPSSIKFEGNTYNSPEKITFHWVGKQELSLAQWKNAGRQ